jgi:hypothetical protein
MLCTCLTSFSRPFWQFLASVLDKTRLMSFAQILDVPLEYVKSCECQVSTSTRIAYPRFSTPAATASFSTTKYTGYMTMHRHIKFHSFFSIIRDWTILEYIVCLSIVGTFTKKFIPSFLKSNSFSRTMSNRYAISLSFFDDNTYIIYAAQTKQENQK